MGDKVIFVQGNEACVEGALYAGLGFFAGYPITPSTEIAELLSIRLPQRGGKFIQMEDEIASMAAIIGAAVGGAKAMTATSGPGFSLMQENIGYAVMTEAPCVVVDVQRNGPSTGLPTAPAQGDVMQARWGTHGDHPIIALTASTVRGVFNMTVLAFNFSEKYRTPVILLLDEVVSHLREKVTIPEPESLTIVNREIPEEPPEWYQAYKAVPSDVPPLAPFGTGYRYHMTGLHHDPAGYPTTRVDEIDEWIERVYRKIEGNRREICVYKEYQTEDAETLLIAYGVMARTAREALKWARTAGEAVGLLELYTLWPFPVKVVERLSRKVRRIIVPELNLGQVVLEVERVASHRGGQVMAINRANGQLITPQEIVEAIHRPYLR